MLNGGSQSGMVTLITIGGQLSTTEGIFHLVPERGRVPGHGPANPGLVADVSLLHVVQEVGQGLPAVISLLDVHATILI